MREHYLAPSVEPSTEQADREQCEQADDFSYADFPQFQYVATALTRPLNVLDNSAYQPNNLPSEPFANHVSSNYTQAAIFSRPLNQVDPPQAAVEELQLCTLPPVTINYSNQLDDLASVAIHELNSTGSVVVSSGQLQTDFVFPHQDADQYTAASDKFNSPNKVMAPLFDGALSNGNWLGDNGSSIAHEFLIEPDLTPVDDETGQPSPLTATAPSLSHFLHQLRADEKLTEAWEQKWQQYFDVASLQVLMRCEYSPLAVIRWVNLATILSRILQASVATQRALGVDRAEPSSSTRVWLTGASLPWRSQTTAALTLAINAFYKTVEYSWFTTAEALGIFLLSYMSYLHVPADEVFSSFFQQDNHTIQHTLVTAADNNYPNLRGGLIFLLCLPALFGIAAAATKFITSYSLNQTKIQQLLDRQQSSLRYTWLDLINRWLPIYLVGPLRPFTNHTQLLTEIVLSHGWVSIELREQAFGQLLQLSQHCTGLARLTVLSALAQIIHGTSLRQISLLLNCQYTDAELIKLLAFKVASYQQLQQFYSYCSLQKTWLNLARLHTGYLLFTLGLELNTFNLAGLFLLKAITLILQLIAFSKITVEIIRYLCTSSSPELPQIIVGNFSLIQNHTLSSTPTVVSSTLAPTSNAHMLTNSSTATATSTARLTSTSTQSTAASTSTTGTTAANIQTAASSSSSQFTTTSSAPSTSSTSLTISRTQAMTTSLAATTVPLLRQRQCEQTCRNIALALFSKIPGESTNLLANGLGSAAVNVSCIDLSGKNWNGGQIANVLQVLAQTRNLTLLNLTVANNLLQSADDIAAFSPWLPSVRVLDLSNNGGDNSELVATLTTVLPQITHLRRLVLDNTYIEILADCTVLASLAQAIRTLLELEELSLVENWLGFSVDSSCLVALVDSLIASPRITALNLANNMLDNSNNDASGLAKLADFFAVTGLARLNLSNTQLGTNYPDVFSNMIRRLNTSLMITLDLSRTALGTTENQTRELGERLAIAERLEVLNIANTFVGAQPNELASLFRNMIGMHQLRKLFLNNIQLTDGDTATALFNCLPTLSNLQELRLDDNFLGPRSIANLTVALRTLTNLTEFSFLPQNADVLSAMDIAKINQALSHTQTVNYIGLPLFDNQTIANFLQQFPPEQTTALNLTGLLNYAAEEAIHYFAAMLSQYRSLETLKLGKNNFGYISSTKLTIISQVFGQLTGIKQLDLSENHIGFTDDVPLRIFNNTAQLQQIKILNVSSNFLGNSGVELAFTQTLQYFPAVTVFDATNNGLGTDPLSGLVELGQAIQKWAHNLQELWLGHNQIGMQPNLSQGLLDSLSLLRQLKKLSLQSNPLIWDPNLITRLASACSKLDSLESIDLSNMALQYSMEESLFLFQQLRYLRSLKSLNLADNLITDRNMTLVLADSLSKMTNLTNIDLSNNPIGKNAPDATDALLQALAKLPNLQSAKLAGIQNVNPQLASAIFGNYLPSYDNCVETCWLEGPNNLQSRYQIPSLNSENGNPTRASFCASTETSILSPRSSRRRLLHETSASDKNSAHLTASATIDWLGLDISQLLYSGFSGLLLGVLAEYCRQQLTKIASPYAGQVVASISYIGFSLVLYSLGQNSLFDVLMPIILAEVVRKIGQKIGTSQQTTNTLATVAATTLTVAQNFSAQRLVSTGVNKVGFWAGSKLVQSFINLRDNTCTSTAKV